MTKQTNTCAAAAKPLGVWIDELKADRDEWKARAERAEGALRRIDAEPGLTLADAYRAGLEPAAEKAYTKGVKEAARFFREHGDTDVVLALIQKDKTDE